MGKEGEGENEEGKGRSNGKEGRQGQRQEEGPHNASC